MYFLVNCNTACIILLLSQLPKKKKTSRYTCEFVQKDKETKSEFDDSSDEPETIESVRQDENFSKPIKI